MSPSARPLFPLLVQALADFDNKCFNHSWQEEQAIRQVRDVFFREPNNPNSRDSLDCVGIAKFREWAKITA